MHEHAVLKRHPSEPYRRLAHLSDLSCEGPERLCKECASEGQTDGRAGQADPYPVRAGERQTDLADEFGVDRKTIRRRLDALERADTERAERIAAKRLRNQAARERRKLLDRENENTSIAMGRTLRDSKIMASMGSKGDPWDNACARVP